MAERLQIEDEEFFEEICTIVAPYPDSYIRALPYLQAARRSVLCWREADAIHFQLEDVRLRRQRFFILICQAFESSTGRRAGITWNKSAKNEVDLIAGEFFSFAKVCHDQMLPLAMQAPSNIAFAKLLERMLKRRTADPLPKNRPGRPRKFPLQK